MSVIDFPNSPTNGDEFQAPNKFVYKWNDGNRWKNIHRPLLIPDYIWPDPDDPTTDPNDPSYTPDPDGGGGDDWEGTVFEAEVISGAALLVDTLEVNVVGGQSDPGRYPGAGLQSPARITNWTSGAGYLTNFYLNDPVCKYPLLADRGGTGGYPVGQDDLTNGSISNASGIDPGTTVYANLQVSTISFQAAGAVSWIKLSDFLSATGYANRTSCRFRIVSAEASRISYNGAGGDDINLRLIPQTAGQVSIGVLSDASEIIWNSASYTPTTKTGPWKNMPANAEYLGFEAKIDEGCEVGNIIIEVDDPWAIAGRTNPPVGFSTNPEMTKSLISFSGLGGNFLREVIHRNPKRLDDSTFGQREDGDTGYLDLDTQTSTSVKWSSLWQREDGNLYAFVDEDNLQVVQTRHLYTPGDLSTHSVVDPSYNFTDYASKTPSLGVDIINIAMSPDGNKLFIMNSDGDMRGYDVTTAWDLSTVDPLTYDTLSLSIWNPVAFDVSQDGLGIVLVKAGWARQVLLDSAWDLSSATSPGIEREFSRIDEPIDISLSADMDTIFILDIPSDTSLAYRIYSYTRPTR